MTHSPELQAALDAAEKAASIARSLYQRNIEIRIKADKSPVTEADVRCELAIREIIEARFPSHGFYGEETGLHRQDAEYLWIVDPIDGTKAFVREYPMFSTQIALMRQGETRIGRLERADLRRSCAMRSADAARSSTANRSQSATCPPLSRRIFLRQHEEPRLGSAMDALRRDDCAARTAFAATAIFCTIICWRRERSMR